MRYGHFDDAAKEYVIERPDTPRPWSNYLGSRKYGGIITNDAGGYSFTRSPAEGRILRFRYNSVPLDQPGRYFYLRDRESGDFWSSSWQPVGKPLEKYQSTCRFGTSYAAIDSRYSGHPHGVAPTSSRSSRSLSTGSSRSPTRARNRGSCRSSPSASSPANGT